MYICIYNCVLTVDVEFGLGDLGQCAGRMHGETSYELVVVISVATYSEHTVCRPSLGIVDLGAVGLLSHRLHLLGSYEPARKT